MAIKPTIYKLNIALSDLDRNHYDALNLTIALHPSETVERMMVRVLSYCINATAQLAFTRGLSAIEEPDLWARTLDGQISLWIDVGEPSIDRIKKAARLAEEVRIYSFNTKSNLWWQQSQTKLTRLPVSVYQFDWESIQSLVSLVQRTMKMSVTITGGSAFVAAESGECEVSWVELSQ
ncbi:MAG: YaeQ family protein [bacterium]|nr:YaeQ family protein [Gammaproteobacteria bacterium]HIL99141.1 YaeQ family protein [Pseudomonadales bacterium]